MDKYLARCTEDRRNFQPLSDHLRGVARRCTDFASQATPSDTRFSAVAGVTGLLHDLGKYRDQFQHYLMAGIAGQKSAETAHAMYGASAACFEFNLQLAAFVIAGHHAGLHDASNLQQLLEGKKFQADQRYPELLRRGQQGHELGRLPVVDVIPFESDDADKRRYEFLTRMLFSMLVDADRLDSEKWEQEQRLQRPWDRPSKPLVPARLLELLDAERQRRAERAVADDLLRLRNDVFDACVAKGRELPTGFFTLTVPTGGAKTLSSMAFSLAHAEHHGLRRVIVVIPYLSIIEQNAREYRKILGRAQVLEHHSAVDLPEKRRDEDSSTGGEPAGASDAEQAMENWDAPIIVTTAVQFVETLFAASPSRARKLHNVARSVVVFDEVQTLPTHLLEPTLDALRELNRNFGVSFLFCSATQPAFRRSASLSHGFTSGELVEVGPDPATTYHRLRRVDYVLEPPGNAWNWNQLADRLVRRPHEFCGREQALCVLNLRRQAFDAWQAIQRRLTESGRNADARDAVFHLSSAMCPAHRLDVLGLSKPPQPNNIKARLESGKPCWVISTQLIEAGVDIDFPIVFRAMGPLDSIVQCAGRCNREGRLTDAAGRPMRGEVVVFHPEDGGLPRGIYERATSITPAHLDPEHVATDHTLFAAYFTELYQLSPMDHSRKGEHTIQEDRAEFNFRRVADRARVIKDDTIAVIVPYGRARTLIRRIRKTGHCDRNTLRRLQRFTVNLRRGPGADYQKLSNLGALQPLLDGRLEIPVLSSWCYDTRFGVIIQQQPPEDFVF
jgi:CRISPR-associated endonuclease/helicase Cas3